MSTTRGNDKIIRRSSRGVAYKFNVHTLIFIKAVEWDYYRRGENEQICSKCQLNISRS